MQLSKGKRHTIYELMGKWVVPVKPSQANTTVGMNVKAECVPCIKLRHSQGQFSIRSVDLYKHFQSGVSS